MNASANVPGSSQTSGSQQPLHTMPMVGSSWSVTNIPATNTIATITQASPGAGLKNVVTGLSFVLAAGAAAPTAVNVTVHLRDGATGAGTPKKSWTLSLAAVAGSTNGIVARPMWVEMTAATATCLEFTAAGGANSFESVEMDGGIIAA